MLKQFQQLAMWKEALASCAIENNTWAVKHLKNIEDMNFEEEYYYLKKVFEEMGKYYE